MAVVIDHFSRKAIGIALFRKQPNNRQVYTFLAKTIRTTAKPKYIICDKGSQFWCLAFKRWCRRRGIKPRFGAIGQYGSIAVIERFVRTLKEEGFRRILVPLNLRRIRSPAKVRGEPGVRLQLVVDFHQGRKHLPVVTLRQVA
jgi:transposase InsO family protein